VRSRRSQGGTAEERCAFRERKSRPIVEEFEPRLRAKLGLISQKTKLGCHPICVVAFRRADASLPRPHLDRPTSSSALSAQSLNRKNPLFAGSDGGGEHWAVIASLIETCKPGPISLTKNAGAWPENIA
jgi:hypothetical protein